MIKNLNALLQHLTENGGIIVRQMDMDVVIPDSESLNCVEGSFMWCPEPAIQPVDCTPTTGAVAEVPYKEQMHGDHIPGGTVIPEGSVLDDQDYGDGQTDLGDVEEDES